MLSLSKNGELYMRAFFDRLNGEPIAVALLDRPTLEGRIWTDGRIHESAFAMILQNHARRIEKCSRSLRERQELLEFGARLENTIKNDHPKTPPSHLIDDQNSNELSNKNDVPSNQRPTKRNHLRDATKSTNVSINKVDNTPALTMYSSQAPLDVPSPEVYASCKASLTMVSDTSERYYSPSISNWTLETDGSAALACAPEEWVDAVAVEVKSIDTDVLKQICHGSDVLKSSKTNQNKTSSKSNNTPDVVPALALVQFPSHQPKAIALIQYHGSAHRSPSSHRGVPSNKIQPTHFVDNGDGASPVINSDQFQPTSKTLCFWSAPMPAHEVDALIWAFESSNTCDHSIDAFDQTQNHTFNCHEKCSKLNNMDDRRQAIELMTALTREFSEATALVDVHHQDVLFISHEAFRLMGCCGPFLDNTCLSKKASFAMRQTLNLGMKSARIVRSTEVLNGVKLLTFQRNVGEFEVLRARDRYRLTKAESTEALNMVAGLSNKESAIRLNLSPETVRQRRKVIYRKMGVSTHGEAIARIFDIHLAPMMLPAYRKRKR